MSESHRLALKSQFARELGVDCEVLLFGSPRLAARAERLLGGRRVDVLLLDPSTDVQPVHAAALATGVPL